MQLRRVAYDDPLVEQLLTDLDREYTRRYGPNEELDRARADEFAPPTGSFLVLEVDGETVAGGGLRWRENGVCELKRMWTAPGRRRQGLARHVLGALEDEARRLGYRTVHLVTGDQQPEAQALYAAAGYTSIPAWGPYEVCDFGFEKSLETP